ncbi:transglutaminase-like cysteine peptidase [Sphingomonas sp. HT-1]|uniref:transglutaminase-like cysteine peptidase n=1 Tax=unclassified Sphingomonas TaxID=196159 RepID=UPI000317DF30|nr:MULTISPECIES: transglutaminase-like cysteine peptidase [unclassified Sphingomonas]KTF68829.1 hypothetical protein ATB93_12155 [Sphingomonas sp. WG]
MLGGLPGYGESQTGRAVAATASIALTLPQHAAIDAGSDSSKLLASVNRLVNSRVRQRTDLAAFGEGELWRRSGIGRGAVGDCEDLAIEKRLQLIDAGYPADRLFFAVVYRRGLGLHTLLLARTDDGDMVLDSRSPYVRPWHEAGYDWISAQAPGEAGRWQTVVVPSRRS